ncbi:MAG: HAMP domain-containing histidine kinase [Bacteroidaceae bacterium]|nr:HAMP domain-containing histidine kinase [Bacteroidaceae bacterium]
MEWINRTRTIKLILIIFAVLLGVGSLVFSNSLVRDLAREESARMEIWTEAMRTFNNADEGTDLTLVLTVIRGNSNIPVIVLDNKGGIDSYSNIRIHGTDTLGYLMHQAAAMREAGHIIRMDMDEPGEYYDVCYDDSLMLKRLEVYPYVQFGVFVVFLAVALFALLSMKRSEQNRVWVGLSKETAHQLGTPISSLMAWTEILRTTYPNDELIPEMSKDVHRLEIIAERFSKIGSLPETTPENLGEALQRVVSYINRRSSEHVTISLRQPERPITVRMCSPLFEWVIENLCKNAIDAMDGEGSIHIHVAQTDERVFIDVEDTGKGIHKSLWGSVFSPGFTTKKRGWGLGLSLAKRIIESYHKGRIYVKHSELNKGTTFRIELKK